MNFYLDLLTSILEVTRELLYWSFYLTNKNIAKGTTDPRVEFCLPK